MLQFHVDAGDKMNSLFDFSRFLNTVSSCGLKNWYQQFSEALTRASQKPDGNLKIWLTALESLPELPPGKLHPELHAANIVSTATEPDQEQITQLKNALLQLKPWRKGPFSLFDIKIDSEWRSDLKWQRVEKVISPLKGRKILDVGCGNGYYMMRMLSQQPELVIGADPSTLFLAQFNAVTRYAEPLPVFLLPIGFEDLPQETAFFDTVFSMGVFYHRRSPFDFLRSLRLMLRPGGELVLETLIVEGDENTVLVPPDRYARMNNVWFIPSAKAMEAWLTKAGFSGVATADISRTTVEEQRATEWMPGESLNCCLQKDNHLLTVEGLPAPVRAVFTATR